MNNMIDILLLCIVFFVMLVWVKLDQIEKTLRQLKKDLEDEIKREVE